MTIYVAVFVTLLILRQVIALEASPSGASNQLSSLIIAGFLALLIVLRVDTGTDFPTYLVIWDYTSTLQELTVDETFFRLLEPLFVLTTSALKTFEPDARIFFVAFGLATVFFLHKSIIWFRINGPHAYLVYVGMFLLPYAFNGMRQALTMSMFLYSLRFILRRKVGMVVLWTIIASGFHLTGILIGLAYIAHRLTELREFSLNRWFLWGAVISSIVGMAGLGGKLFFTIFEYKAETYAELFNESSSIANIAVRLVLAGLLVYGASRAPPSRLLRQLLVMYSLGVFIYLSLSEFNMLATRFNMFFRVLEVILIPMVLERLRGTRSVALHLTFSALMLLALVAVGSSSDYDYQSTLTHRLF